MKFSIERNQDEGNWKWVVYKKRWLFWVHVFHSHSYEECVEFVNRNSAD